jgi:hypothetical protein
MLEALVVKILLNFIVKTGHDIAAKAQDYMHWQDLMIRNIQERQQLLDGGDIDNYPFAFDVAAEVVLRMGGRPKTPSELKAARMLAWQVMRNRDHRIAHCERDIVVILGMITAETEEERILNEMINSGQMFPETQWGLFSRFTLRLSRSFL